MGTRVREKEEVALHFRIFYYFPLSSGGKVRGSCTVGDSFILGGQKPWVEKIKNDYATLLVLVLLTFDKNIINQL